MLVSKVSTLLQFLHYANQYPQIINSNNDDAEDEGAKDEGAKDEGAKDEGAKDEDAVR